MCDQVEGEIITGLEGGGVCAISLVLSNSALAVLKLETSRACTPQFL